MTNTRNWVFSFPRENELGLERFHLKLMGKLNTELNLIDLHSLITGYKE